MSFEVRISSRLSAKPERPLFRVTESMHLSRNQRQPMEGVSNLQSGSAVWKLPGGRCSLTLWRVLRRVWETSDIPSTRILRQSANRLRTFDWPVTVVHMSDGHEHFRLQHRFPRLSKACWPTGKRKPKLYRMYFSLPSGICLEWGEEVVVRP